VANDLTSRKQALLSLRAPAAGGESTAAGRLGELSQKMKEKKEERDKGPDSRQQEV
jgi:hypothetical protein